MDTLCIDLIDTKTEDENEQREDTKRGILYDGTILQNNVPKTMKSENENGHFDVEGDVIKTGLKVEIGNELETETVVSKRISAEHEVLNVHKTAKSVKIKSENEEHQNEKEEFSVKKLKKGVRKMFLMLRKGNMQLTNMNLSKEVAEVFNVTFVQKYSNIIQD